MTKLVLKHRATYTIRPGQFILIIGRDNQPDELKDILQEALDSSQPKIRITNPDDSKELMGYLENVKPNLVIIADLDLGQLVNLNDIIGRVNPNPILLLDNGPTVGRPEEVGIIVVYDVDRLVAQVVEALS